MRDFVREQGITHYYEVGCMGVEHALLPEQGVVGAGDLIIGADSHTCTYGALGAFSTGVGSTDAGVGMATGKAWFKVPETIKFVINGELAPGVTGKDVILHIIGMIGVDGALYKAMEFTGSAIESMPMDERLSISNMAIEAGGKAGLIPVDDVTRAYLDERAERPYTAYYSDDDAQFAQVVESTPRHRADGGLPAPAEQHAPGGRGSRRKDRPGPSSAAAPTGASPTCARPQPSRGPHGASGRALHRHPRQPARLHGSHEGRLHRNLHHCRLCRFDADVRSLPGWLHGHHDSW